MSGDAISIIKESWNPSTFRQYSTYMKQWLSYCQQENISPVEWSIPDGINFLTKLFTEKGLGYSAMNTARSALSVIMHNPDGSTFGNNHLVKKLLRGMFKLRPAIPKYTCTFDAQIVLQYLSGLGDSFSIPFKSLSYRLATLFCLLSGQRDQTLSAIDVRFISLTEDRVICYISKILKTTRPTFHQSPIDFRSYPLCDSICPVKNMQAYLSRSFKLRGPFVKLFISHTEPHSPVTVSTISRWVKETLKLAGINTDIFSSHSTRSAAVSKAKSLGLSISEINRAAGWSNSRTFGLHYNKPIIDINFGRTLVSDELI